MQFNRPLGIARSSPLPRTDTNQFEWHGSESATERSSFYCISSSIVFCLHGRMTRPSPTIRKHISSGHKNASFSIECTNKRLRGSSDKENNNKWLTVWDKNRLDVNPIFFDFFPFFFFFLFFEMSKPTEEWLTLKYAVGSVFSFFISTIGERDTCVARPCCLFVILWVQKLLLGSCNGANVCMAHVTRIQLSPRHSTCSAEATNYVTVTHWKNLDIKIANITLQFASDAFTRCRRRYHPYTQSLSN